MAADSVSARYAQALFGVVKPAGRLDAVLSQLEELAGHARRHSRLQDILRHPAVTIDEKLSVCAAALGGAWQEDLLAFMRMVLSFGRAEGLLGMAEAFRRLVDADRNVARATVRSAWALTPVLRAKLVDALQRGEGRTIALEEDIAPELIGGLQVLIGHRMVDGSLQGRLAELRQRLKSVRV